MDITWNLGGFHFTLGERNRSTSTLIDTQHCFMKMRCLLWQQATLLHATPLSADGFKHTAARQHEDPVLDSHASRAQLGIHNDCSQT